ncbi:hypothetical protein niasHT_010003 [Heterodera trifolii]|uniref:HTH La-type RNA-binding domain-containing protein n=1 Tax=Heterodera trifolii TaxID=157864 RepID=A0ABD2MAP9_9BILA
MRGFELDGGAFFMCTEISPRCYTIQQLSDVDDALKGFAMRRPSQTSASASPPAFPSAPRPFPSAGLSTCASNSPLPMLPWWFTAECRQELMGVPPPPPDERVPTPDTRPPSSVGEQPMSPEQLRQRIRRQLEYYFSRENLVNDRYLRCQMDADQYVPIKIVANFPKVSQLSTDLDLIVDILKSSPQLQVDESGQKVRPLSRRCTIILREIPADADEKEVKAMFGDGCPPFRTLSYGLNNSWYVTFASEQDTQMAFFHLQTLGKTFNGNPVFARIKTGGAPIGADVHSLARGNMHFPLTINGGALRGQLIVHHGHHGTDQSEHNRNTPSPSSGRQADNAAGKQRTEFDLGQILAQCGYSPRATFKPLALSAAPLPTTAVPQPTSFFTQPILHNGDSVHCASFHQTLRRLFCHSLEEMPKNGEIVGQHFDGFRCAGEKCFGECAQGTFDGVMCGCFEESSLVLCEKENLRLFRKRRRAHSEPPLAYCSVQFAVGRNESVLRQCAKDDNRSWDPAKLAATMLPSPVPRITDVPRLNGMGGISTKEGGLDETGEKHCSTPMGGAFAGFQRQESVEAYQIAVAANGVAKQRRMTLEIEEEEEQWESVSNRKNRRKPTEKCQRSRHFHDNAKLTLTAEPTAAEEQQHSDRRLFRLFGTRSFDSVRPRPLSDSLQSCHENDHFGDPAKINRFSKSTNQSSKSEFSKIVWHNDSTEKLTLPTQQQFVPMPNRIVPPLLSLTSATFSPPSCAFQQHRGPSFSGTTRGGRRSAAEIIRRFGGRRGRTWNSEWSRPVTTISNVINHPQQQMEEYGLIAKKDERMVREMEEVETEKRTKRERERDGSVRETAGETTRRTKTVEQKRQTQQNGGTLCQQRHFGRHSRETAEKDDKQPKCSLRKEAPNGAREEADEGQQKRRERFNFEEREFPALLSCADHTHQNGDAHQSEKVPGVPSLSAALPSIDPQKTPSVSSCVPTDAPSTPNRPSGVQLKFSAVVAGHGRRRATIGTATEGARKGATGGGEPRAKDGTREEATDDSRQQPRSGTIGGTERSYAQMLKGWAK